MLNRWEEEANELRNKHLNHYVSKARVREAMMTLKAKCYNEKGRDLWDKAWKILGLD